MRFSTLCKTLSAVAVLSVLALQMDVALADTATTGIAKVASDVTSQLKGLLNFLNIAAYVAGVGFTLTGIMKFKAHKDNPQQVPLSQPIVLIAVGAALLFLPSVLKIAGATIFTDTGAGGGGADWSGTISQ